MASGSSSQSSSGKSGASSPSSVVQPYPAKSSASSASNVANRYCPQRPVGASSLTPRRRFSRHRRECVTTATSTLSRPSALVPAQTQPRLGGLHLPSECGERLHLDHARVHSAVRQAHL